MLNCCLLDVLSHQRSPCHNAEYPATTSGRVQWKTLERCGEIVALIYLIDGHCDMIQTGIVASLNFIYSFRLELRRGDQEVQGSFHNSGSDWMDGLVVLNAPWYCTGNDSGVERKTSW